MWVFEKKLEFPVDIKKQNPALAKLILAQYGGPDGELGAALRYLSQRFAAVTPEAKATLNDIGTEELAHLEMIGTICSQLNDEISPEQIIQSGLSPYYVDHGTGVYPANASGVPWSASTIQSTGNPITDLYEDLAAEQKAKATYEYIINLTDDEDVLKPIRFLREREVVHFQRFGEALGITEEYINGKHKFYMPGGRDKIGCGGKNSRQGGNAVGSIGRGTGCGDANSGTCGKRGLCR